MRRAPARIRLDGLIYRHGPRIPRDDDGNALIGFEPMRLRSTLPFEGPVIVDREAFEIRNSIVTLPDWAADVLMRHWGFVPA